MGGRAAAALALAGLCALSLGSLGASGALTIRLVFSEDFESGWNPAFRAYDEDVRSGEDYWGATQYVARSGSRSAGAAAVGTNADGLPNLYESDGTWTARYDDNMSASMDLRVGPAAAFTERSVSFYFAAYTEPWTVDFLSVLAFDGAAWETLWSQNVTTTVAFYFVNLTLPAATEWISFHFFSDGNASAYPGAFVDDVSVWGKPAPDSVSPSSVASVVSERTTSFTFNVTFTATDAGGSLDAVELWARPPNGTFAWYAVADVLGDRAEGAFHVDVSGLGGYGAYEFYTIAVDAAGNREAAPTDADARIVVERGPSVGPPLVVVGAFLWIGAAAGVTAAVVAAAFLLERRRRRGA